MQAGQERLFLNITTNRAKQAENTAKRDCYFISNTEVSLYLSVENLGMEFAVKIAVADLKRGGVIYDCVVKKFVFSKNELPESGSSGELCTRTKASAAVDKHTERKILKCDFIDFGGIKIFTLTLISKRRRAKVLTKLHRLRETENIFISNALFPNLSQAELSVLAAWNIL